MSLADAIAQLEGTLFPPASPQSLAALLERAEEDFTGSLKEGLAAEPANPPTPAPAPTGPGPAAKTELDKNAGADALKQNANLLNQLK